MYRKGKGRKNSTSLPRKNNKGSKSSSQAPGPSKATGSQLKEDKGIGKTGGGGHTANSPKQYVLNVLAT